MFIRVLCRTLVVALVALVVVGCGTNGTTLPSTLRLGAIQGTVTDESGEPVPTVRVSIVGGTAAFPEIASETDEKGRFTTPKGKIYAWQGGIPRAIASSARVHLIHTDLRPTPSSQSRNTTTYS